MNHVARTKRIVWLLLLFFCLASIVCFAADDVRVKADEEIEAKRLAAAKAEREAADEAEQKAAQEAAAKIEEEIARLDLPEDNSQRLEVRELRISGNTLVSTEKLMAGMPLVFNASVRPLHQAASGDLYDFRVLNDIIQRPGEPREVSTRTIQGFTQYVLSCYQKKNLAGIYVYVPKDALVEGAQLRDGILPVSVLEAPVTQVTVKSYDAEQNEKEEGYLLKSAVEQWSPVRTGKVANQKELDDFVNLLNLNPDRYVSAVVTRGAEPNSLAVAYDIYEAHPWHWFIQADNSGTKDRQWSPRIGLINTNLLGIDDTFTAIYQAPVDSSIEDNYSLFGSYDFPVAGPKLRLNLYGGYSEFDIDPDTGPFNFLGSGTFYGSLLRYNAFQKDGWFFDLLGGVSHEESKVTPSLFPTFLATDLKMDFWNVGTEIYHSDDMSNTSFSFVRTECVGGSDRDEFLLSRAGTSPDFIVYSATADHSQYTDPNKIQRIAATFRFIGSNERLAPAKMTTFGGMYTVRGYDEDEIVADGGALASMQYEFDIVKYEESMDIGAADVEEQEEPFLRKLAPLAFVDYGRARIKDHIRGSERRIQQLLSVGTGTVVELGDNFTGAVYYGYPLKATDSTRVGKGRVNIGLMMRW